MKKLVSLFLTLCMLLSVVSVMAVTVKAEDAAAITPDTAWYDNHKEDTDLYIGTPAELLGFATLLTGQLKNDAVLADAAADAKIFVGKTVHLRADIDLNPMWTVDAEGKTTAPANVWSAVTNHGFTGMFDGGGHTISGIYFASEGDNVGIFGNPRGGTEEAPVGVKNLAIVNSYISATGSQVGALFGSTANLAADKQDNANVLIENVYLDVTMYTTAASKGNDDGKNTGGVIGAVFTESTVTIRNTVVNGRLDAPNGITAAGGFIGLATCAGSEVKKGDARESERNCNVTIEDSLFCGVLNARYDLDGGFVGRASSYLTINRCMEAGDVYPSAYIQTLAKVGSMIGWSVYPNNKITNCLYTDVYVGNGDYNKGYSTGSAVHGTGAVLGTPVVENSTHVTDAELTGIVAAEKLTAAGMSATWTVTTTGLPMPRSIVMTFGETLLTRADAAETPVVEMKGYQTTDVADGKFDLRLVAGLKLPEGKTVEDYTHVGFRVAANYGNTTKTKTYTTNTVYESVRGYDKSAGNAIDYTAESLGADYLFVLPCTNVPANAGAISVEVTVFYMTADGDIVDGGTQVYMIQDRAELPNA